MSTPTMRRLHAVGREAGHDHDALHAWARGAYGVESLTHLSERQARELIEALRGEGERRRNPLAIDA